MRNLDVAFNQKPKCCKVIYEAIWCHGTELILKKLSGGEGGGVSLKAASVEVSKGGGGVKEKG
jgi:hypothetical protein